MTVMVILELAMLRERCLPKTLCLSTGLGLVLATNHHEVYDQRHTAYITH